LPTVRHKKFSNFVQATGGKDFFFDRFFALNPRTNHPRAHCEREGRSAKLSFKDEEEVSQSGREKVAFAVGYEGVVEAGRAGRFLGGTLGPVVSSFPTVGKGGDWLWMEAGGLLPPRQARGKILKKGENTGMAYRVSRGSIASGNVKA